MDNNKNNNNNNQNNETNGNNNGSKSGNNNNNGSQNNSNNQQNNGGSKQITEQELEVLLAERRVSGKNEFLKSLGFDGDEDGLKETLKRVMEEDEKNQTELDRVTKALNKTKKALEIAEEARIAAESKLAAIKLGAKPETVDDLVILASAKVEDGKDLNKVLVDLKKSYPMYFKDDDSNNGGDDSGTSGHLSNNNINGGNNSGNNNNGNNNQNNPQGNNGGKNGGGSLVERLMANRGNTGKSNFFKKK